MDLQPVLEGERLRLRPLEEGDWAALYAIASDRELWAQHPAGDRWQEDVFRTFFGDALAHGGAMVAEDKASGTIIASSQFRPCPIAPDELEIGWTLVARTRWGDGTNREMKRLMLTHALSSWPRVLFRVGETNWRSRKAMEKIGGRLVDMVEEGEYKGRAIRHVVYEITRSDFLAGPLSHSSSGICNSPS